MKSTDGMVLAPTRHALQQILDKGFAPEAIKAAFARPTEVYPSGSHPGQFRVTGQGLCLVGKPEGKKFTLITVYEDRVLTPPRPDQMDTPEGRLYADRYAKGLGRGGNC